MMMSILAGICDGVILFGLLVLCVIAWKNKVLRIIALCFLIPSALLTLAIFIGILILGIDLIGYLL